MLIGLIILLSSCSQKQAYINGKNYLVGGGSCATYTTTGGNNIICYDKAGNRRGPRSPLGQDLNGNPINNQNNNQNNNQSYQSQPKTVQCTTSYIGGEVKTFSGMFCPFGWYKL